MVLIEKTEVVAKKVPIEKQDADELNQGDERPEFKKEEMVSSERESIH